MLSKSSLQPTFTAKQTLRNKRFSGSFEIKSSRYEKKDKRICAMRYVEAVHDVVYEGKE